MTLQESLPTTVLAVREPLLSAALASFMSAGGHAQVVASSDGPAEALRYVRGHKPRVILFVPDGDAHRSLLKEIPQVSPETAALALLSESDPYLARDLMREGSDGVVELADSPDSFLYALQAVSSGDGYVSPRLAVKITHLGDGHPGGLSSREAEILALIALGYTNQEIADKLFLSVRTVETHRANIMDKLSVRSRHEMVRFALEHRLIPDPDFAD